MGVQISVDSEAPVSLLTSSQSVTLQGLDDSFLLQKFLPVAMQQGDPCLAVFLLVGNVQAFGAFGKSF